MKKSQFAYLLVAFVVVALAIFAWDYTHDFKWHLNHECIKNSSTGSKYTEYKCEDGTFFLLTTDVDR